MPATLDEADRSIDVVWSTGARVRRQPFFGEPFDEELSMDPAHVRLERLNGGAPLLKAHDRFALESVIGSVVPGTARIENGRGVARVRFSDREDVAPIWTDIRDGHIRAVSIGYQVQRYEISKPANSPELWRAVDWTPFEISAVPVGADPAAGFRSVDPLMPCVVTRDDASHARTITMDKTDVQPDLAPLTDDLAQSGAQTAPAACPLDSRARQDRTFGRRGGNHQPLRNRSARPRSVRPGGVSRHCPVAQRVRRADRRESQGFHGSSQRDSFEGRTRSPWPN